MSVATLPGQAGTRLRVLRGAESVRPATSVAVVPRTVPLLTTLLAVIATILSWRSGSLTLYGDARAHLDVARHVTDGLTPGLAQIGSVWLPLQHLLMAPLVTVGQLWHSGLAGSIVGGISFVYSCVRIFSLAQEWMGSRRCAWVALAIFATNANLLYVQSTALTEPLLIACFIGAAYHLARWTRTLSHRHLLPAALMTGLAALTRYDGWFLFAVGFVLVLLWSRAQERRRGATEANSILFAAVGGFGILVWLLYNLIIFHDPLYFMHSNFSAQAQQTALQQYGMLDTRGHLGLAALTYGWAVLDVAGAVVVALGILGILDLLVSRGVHWSRDLTLLAFIAAPVIFNVLSLWTGQSTLRVPEAAQGGMWNIRYALLALPLLSLGGAALARGNALSHRTILAVVTAAALVSAFQTPITLADGRLGTSSAAAGHPELVASYLGTHYAGGEVLADEASSAPTIFASGLDLSQYVTIGEHPYYENALAAPGSSVTWIVAVDGDAISTEIATHPDRYRGFATVVRDGRARLLERLQPGCTVPGPDAPCHLIPGTRRPSAA